MRFLTNALASQLHLLFPTDPARYRIGPPVVDTGECPDALSALGLVGVWECVG